MALLVRLVSTCSGTHVAEDSTSARVALRS